MGIDDYSHIHDFFRHYMEYLKAERERKAAASKLYKENAAKKAEPAPVQSELEKRKAAMIAAR